MEIQNLENELRKASWLYYNDPEKSTMSDQVYDEKVKQLKKLSPESSFFKEIGASPQDDLVKHYKKMYSLDNALNKEEFNSFLKKTTSLAIVASLKLDGASVELIYDQGKLVLASSRGNGLYGENCLNKIAKIVPEQIEYNGLIQITGEVVISGDEFEKFKDEFSSPRNLAAGSLMTKDNDFILLERGIKFYAFDCSLDFDYVEKLEFFEELGIETVPYLTSFERGYENVFKELLSQRSVFYKEIGPADGVVFRINDYNTCEKFGYSEKAPKFAIAYKFPDEEKIVKVNLIRWDISKNGTLTPVAEIEPVKIDGAEIRNVTLHNARTVRDNKIAVGALIKIIRSGGVIPKFIEKVESSPNFSVIIPQSCIHCGGPLEDDGVRIKCLNKNCPPRLIDFIVDFLNKCDFKGLADKSIETLTSYKTANGYLIQSLHELFMLDYNDLMNALGYSKDHANKVICELRNLKNISFEKLLSAINVDMVGKVYSRRIAEFVDYKILKTLDENKIRVLMNKIFGSGETSNRIANSLINEGMLLLDQLAEVGFKIVDRKNKGNGKNFVITGTLSQSRKYYQELIEQAGHTYQSSLTRETDYLVVGEDIGNNKINKAKKYGTKIINENELKGVLENEI